MPTLCHVETSMKDANILIVIDNVLERKNIMRELEKKLQMKHFSQTHSAKNALNAVRDQKNLHLVIVDYELPDVTGIELVKKCKTLPGGNSASYLLLSSKQDKSTLLEAASAGVNEFIVKPYSAEMLIQKVSKIFKSDANRRAYERVALFAAVTVKLAFEGKEKAYKGKLLDLSLGGCLVAVPVFGPDSGTIYSPVNLTINTEGEKFNVTGELVRTEKYSEDHIKPGTWMRVAMEFSSMEASMIDKISKLMALSNSPS